MSDVLAGTPLGDVILAAQRAMKLGEVDAARNAYAQALVRLPAGVKGTELRRALWSEHVGGSLAHEHLRSAWQLLRTISSKPQAAGDEPTQLVLLVLLAEAWAAQDAWPELSPISIQGASAPEDPAQRNSSRGRPRTSSFAPAWAGGRRRRRLRTGDIEILPDAGRRFAALGNAAGERAVGNDLRRLDLASGQRVDG